MHKFIKGFDFVGKHSKGSREVQDFPESLSHNIFGVPSLHEIKYLILTGCIACIVLPTCHTRWPVRSFVLTGSQTIKFVPETDNFIPVSKKGTILFLPPPVKVGGKSVVAPSITCIVEMATVTSGT